MQSPSEGLEAAPGAGLKPPPADSTPANLEREKRERRRTYVRNYNREWAKRNPERIREIRKRDHAKNAIGYRARARKYAATPKSKARVRAYMAIYLPAYYKKNRKRLNEMSAVYSKANPDCVRRKNLRWRESHPDSYKAHARAGHVRRKARLRSADVGCLHVNPLIRRWRMKKRFVCYWCDQPFGINSLHIDHIVPVSKGGKHEASNVCQSCPECNLRKKDYLQSEPKYRGQLVLL